MVDEANPDQVDAADAVLTSVKEKYNNGVASSWNALATEVNTALQTFSDIGVDSSPTVAALNATKDAINASGAKLKGMIDEVAKKKKPPQPPPPTTDDWATLSVGRIFARRLASADATDANLAARHPYADVCVWTPDTPTSDLYTEPVIDPAMGALLFPIETGKGPADWVFRIPPFGMNSFLALYWRLQFNQVFVDTVFQMAGGGYPGIKLAIVSLYERSSPSNKLVVSTMDQHKFPFLYRYDWATGATQNIEPAINNGTDFDWQPKQGQPATCLYSTTNRTPQGVAVPGCDTLVGDKWITFYLEAATGGEVANSNGNAWHCTMRLWMIVDGIRKLVIDYGPQCQGYTGRRAEPWTGVWLVPYMTGRDLTQTFPSQPKVWAKEVILDNKPILQGTALPTIDSFTVTPSSVTAGSTVTVAWQTTNATKVTLNGEVVTPDGSKQVVVNTNTQFSLVAEEAVSGSTSVTVTTAPSPPSTGGESADGTKIPPAAQIVDSQAHVWTMNASKQAVRDGTAISAWGALLAIKYYGHDVYVQGDSGAWYLVVGNNLTSVGAEPGGTTTTPPPTQPPTTPPPTTTGPLPAFTPQRDADGAVTNYASLPLKQWHEIADSKMVKLLPQLPQSNNNDMNNVMANWGSSANDPATGDMHLHGGAHGANGQNNGWYTFNTKRADWKITVPPLYMGATEIAYLDKCAKLYYPNDPSASYNGSWNMGMPPEFLFLPQLGSVTGDPTLASPNAVSSGKVFAHHCWLKLVWVEWMQRAFVSLQHFYFLDPVTGNIEVKQKHNDTDWQYNTADPVTKRIYGFTRMQYYEYWDFREYDPVADSALVDYPLGQLYAANGVTKLDKSKYSFSQSNMQVTVDREIVFWNPVTKVWYAFHMDNKTWRALFWQELPFQSSAGDYSGVYFNGKIICCQGWGKLYEVDTTTGAVTAAAVTGPDNFGNATVNNGLFRRLNLQGNLLFALDWATSNVKVMRLA